MNRTGIFATALIACTLPGVPGGAQAALVVGSVRDQHGAVIERAEVTALGPFGGRLAGTTTDAAGTFALEVEGAVRVSVTCRYCMPVSIALQPGEPVVAIVPRFDALFAEAPSPDDVVNLPYAHVESSVALHPFSLLRQTTAVLPGSQFSDRGLAPADALLVDAGVPDYDFVLGTSPYGTIPQAYQQTASVTLAEQAFTYGDRAASGVVALDPFSDSNALAALTGSDQTLRLQAGSSVTNAIAATYSNDSESRQRADAQVQLPLSAAQTLLFSGGTSQGRQYGDPESNLDQSFTFTRGVFDDAQPSVDLNATFLADRGGYAAEAGGLTQTELWSDSSFTAGARTRGPAALFADVSDRLSTGIYDASAYGQPRIAGTLTQTRIDAGIDAILRDVNVTAGIGWFGIGFTGGSDGTSAPSSAHLATPSIDVRILPDAKWSANLTASDSFTLPNLWQQYAFNSGYGSLTYDRNALVAGTLSYTDNARVRVTLEGASQHVSGFTNGTVSSSGLAIAWQIAPRLALRGWAMHVGDSTVASGGNPLYPSGMPASVDAIWLTYDNGGALRADAIYRRDILNGQPFEHVDGDISGPIVGRVRWYAGVEDLEHSTHLDVGLRFASNP